MTFFNPFIKRNVFRQLTEEDFLEAELLEDLELGHNSLKSLDGTVGSNGDGNGGNSVLYPLRSLRSLNLTHNELREFSFASLRGLRELRMLDLSNNRIGRLHRGRTPSEVLIHCNSVTFFFLLTIEIICNQCEPIF